MKKEYQMCRKCIIDTSDPDIKFDDNGICNHCRSYDEIVKKYILSSSEREVKLNQIISKIKKDGKNKKYDCIIGLSGGIDSTYIAYLTSKYDLKPLAVHIDNGWDSKEAKENIERIIKKYRFDIYNINIDWEEFKDLQRSYFKASVMDIEVLTDHAITGFIYKLLLQKKIKYFLKGSNIVTEAIMPESWRYTKTDIRNIKAIQNIFGTRKIKNFPFVSTFKYEWHKVITKKFVVIPILNYIEYNKLIAKNILKKEISWEDYGLKHYESIFTRFYQAYILPKKFGIDKRRAHLSNMICSGQMFRKVALEEIKKNPYPPKLFENDKKYVLNKLGFSEEEFNILMRSKPKSHLDYPNEKAMMRCLIFIYRFVKPLLK